MSDNTDALILPIVSVQPTLPAIIAEVRDGIIPLDKFWVSCYKSGSSSVHATVQASLDEVDRDLVTYQCAAGAGGVEVKQDGNNLTVACPELGIPYSRVIFPAHEYADSARSHPQNPHRITAFDISPDGTKFATGFLDGSIHIYPTNTTHTPAVPVKRTCKPHHSLVTSLRFFPSSQVLLSAGADFSLNILPAPPSSSFEQAGAPLEPARTLRAHTRTITSTAIVARGRNVLSSSTDGTVRLWEVSSGEVIRAMGSAGGKHIPVTRMSLGEKTDIMGRAGLPPDGEIDVLTATAAQKDQREVETQDKVVFCALKDGTFEVLDLGSKTSLYRSKEPRPAAGRRAAALNAISYSDKYNLVATASADGVVTIYDVRSLDTPVTSFSRNKASIEDLLFVGAGEEVRLVVVTEDGLPYIANVRPEGPSVFAELVGGDCDPVRCVKEGMHGEVWTASDDGIVRRYKA